MTKKPSGMTVFEWRLRQGALKAQERALTLRKAATAAQMEADARWRASGAYSNAVKA